jgi:hypothetical protein
MMTPFLEVFGRRLQAAKTHKILQEHYPKALDAIFLHNKGYKPKTPIKKKKIVTIISIFLALFSAPTSRGEDAISLSTVGLVYPPY